MKIIMIGGGDTVFFWRDCLPVKNMTWLLSIAM